MQIGSYEFRPGLVPTLAVAIILPLLAALGFWQLERAEETQAYLQSLQSSRQATPIDLNKGLPSYSAVHHHLVTAHGRYDTAHQFLLANQVRNGRLGYHVLTPLRLGKGHAIIVDRGWVPAPVERGALPDVSVSESRREVRGLVGKGPSVGIRLGKTYVGDGSWPRRILYADFAYMEKALPYQIPPYLIRLAPEAEAGFVYAAPRPSIRPEKHLGYAAQWFTLAVALVVIYLMVNVKRRPHER